MADTPIPEGLTEEVAEIYNAMEFDDLELQEMVMLAIEQGILAERAAQAERIRELEEALTKRIEWHRCLCPEPCDDYGVFPGGCTGRYREDYHKLRAALGGNADANR